MKKGKNLIIAFSFTLALAVLSFFAFQIFTPRFETSYSFILYSEEGKLLGARVADDEQWRFPPSDFINEKYQKSLISYEDKNFFFHFGVDPLAVCRAVKSNLENKRIVSGASTISMQVARLSNKNPNRSFSQKIKEALSALFLEIAFTKEEILKIYATHAPYGGNVVGIESASWRYFSRSTQNLTWAEATMLTVLPNQPALITLSKNRNLLKSKRDKVLHKLFLENQIDEEEYNLALQESIPEKPRALPNISSHYLEYLKNKSNKNLSYRINTSINYKLQSSLYKLANEKFKHFSLSDVYNLAILVLDNKTGKTLAYIGNAGNNLANKKNEQVDMVQAKRSSGSLLKPFLFAAMIDAGMLLPEQLMPDIPTKISGYSPENNTHTFRGAIPAEQALTFSLNVPFVLALKDFTVPAFLDLLKRTGFTTFNRTADEYGLPLILGGGEITLYEITNAYRNLMLQTKAKDFSVLPYSSGASRLTLDSLTKANRPEEEAIWQLYADKQKIAWKTGTSYGNKDAWTIGVNEKYTVGVWCGNATGEGRPEITSTKLAAPILFEVFSLLPKADWPELRMKNFEYITICKNSGYTATKFCEKRKKTFKPKNTTMQKTCPYCRTVSLSPDGKFQALASDIKEIPKIEKRFVLPASMEYYYSQINPSYNPLPTWLKNSKGSSKDDFQILFPEQYAQVFIPIQLSGEKGAVVAQASHKNSDAIIYWDLDGEYLGKTEVYHQMKIQTKKGKHILTLTDNRGQIKKRIFYVLNKE